MKLLLKKFITLALTGALLSQSLYADFWEEMGVESLHDTTTGYQKHVGANGQSIHSYGGSLTIKRKVPNYPAWWSVQGPEISASCSGISFKGMFGAIANLDEITEQFEEAGTTLAWGVLVAIIYSLPGIGEIFTKLDSWAKKIQAMLANACALGTSIGKSVGEDVMTETDNWIGGQIGSAPSHWAKDTGLKSFSDNISGILDCDPDMYKDMGKTLSACNAMKTGAIAQLGSGYVSSPSIFVSAILKQYRQDGSWPGETTKGIIHTIEWSSVGNINSDLVSDLAFATIVASVVGDTVVSSEYAKVAASSLKVALSDSSSKASKKEAINELTKAYKKELNSETTSEKPLSMIGAIKFLLDGANGFTTPAASGDSNTSTPVVIETNIDDFVNSLRIPNVLYFFKDDVDSKAGGISAMAVSDHEDTENIIIKRIRDYKGVSQIALETKKFYLDGINNVISSDTNASENPDISATGPLVDIDLVRYYAKVYRNTSNPAIKKYLGDGYLRLIEFHLTYALYDKVIELTSKIMQNTSPTAANFLEVEGADIPDVDVASTAKGKAAAKLEKLVLAFTKEFKDEIDNRYDADEQTLIYELTYLFKIQDRENLKNAYNK